MVRFVKNYWLEILVFGAIFAAIMIDLAPDMTWMHVDSDGVEYVMDAKYFYPAHHTSAPLYLLIGHLFLLLPFGTEYWRMSFMSGLFTMGCLVYIYLIVRHLITNQYSKYYASLACLIFGASALVIAQSTIVETYAVVTLFSIGAYYYTIKKNWVMVSVMLGLGLVTHHLILLTWFVLTALHRELRNWRMVLISFSFLIFYIYMPLSIMFTDQPEMWGNTGFADFFKNNIGVFNMLVGKVSIWDFPKRIIDTLGVLGISFGLALIPIFYFICRVKKDKNWELVLLFALPIIYVVTDLALQIQKYQMASIAWGAIITVLVLSKIKLKWSYAVWASSIILLITNTLMFDIGRTLDPELSAAKFYKEELPKIPDGDIFVTNGAWEWIEVFYYNKENDREIVPVCMGILASDRYRNMLRDKGVVLEEKPPELALSGNSAHDLNAQQVAYAMSIVRNNEGVWTSKSTTPETYGAIVVPAQGNEDRITWWLGEPNVIPKWQFKPSSPYDMITGAIEVEQWNFILMSNYNVTFFGIMIGIALVLNYLIFVLPKRRKLKQVKAEV